MDLRTRHDMKILPQSHAPPCNSVGGFVISGVGVQQGVVIDEMKNIDVTPTMAKLLGIPFPNADGQVLEKALKK